MNKFSTMLISSEVRSYYAKEQVIQYLRVISRQYIIAVYQYPHGKSAVGYDLDSRNAYGQSVQVVVCVPDKSALLRYARLAKPAPEF